MRGRRHAADRHQPAVDISPGRPAADPRSPGRALRAPAGGGRGHRDVARGPGAPVRAVLHHQGAWARGPGWAWRRCSASSRAATASSRSRPRPAPAPRSRCSCRRPPRAAAAHADTARARGAGPARPGDRAAGRGRGRCAPGGRTHPGRTRLPRADRQQRRSGAGPAGVHHRAHRPPGHRRGDARHQRAHAGRDRPPPGPRRVPVLFVSGYSEREAQEPWHDGAGSAFLQKPFTPILLARKVRELLDRAGRAVRSANVSYGQFSK